MDTETLRLTLLANGYTPLRNRDKRTFMSGWPDALITEDEIRKWSRQTRDRATGLRIENGLAAVDIDVDDAETVDAIAQAVFDTVDALGLSDAPLPTRYGRGAKEAWFVRTDEAFSRIATRGWTKPGETPEDGVYRVEIFGGSSPRQFGAFGPHTVADDGQVLVEYAWRDDVSPANVPLAALPILTKHDFFATCDAAEGVLRARGWSPVEGCPGGEIEPVRVYDLQDGMAFDLIDGRTVDLEALRQIVRDGGETRCSASWLEGATAKNRTRCLVTLTRGGHVAIWESAAAITHVEATAKPVDHAEAIDRFAEKLKALKDQRRLRIRPGEGALPTASKLLEAYAFCPSQQTPVLPVYGDALSPGMTVTNFRLSMLPNIDEDVGPRGGRIVINPVDLWLGSERRITVAGRAMRPDRAWPLFDEDGSRWINTYKAPDHLGATGGAPDGGLVLIEQIAPDPAERAYLTQWLAHKHRYPAVPGPALVMVAHEAYGTGRGTFAELLGRLFGPSYVKQLSFEHISGRTSQAQYTDWQADTLVAFVAEALDAPGGEVWHAKHNAYERLKELVETSPTLKTLIAKGKPAFQARVFASYVIATNHSDALVIPPEDRRFYVISNGQPRDTNFWKRMRAWMQDDANIAALGAWLAEVDLSTYDPHIAPPMTRAKETMIDQGRSDLDKAFDEARRALVTETFVVDQIVAAMRHALNTTDYSFPANWQDVVKRMVTRKAHRVGKRDSTNWQIKIKNRKYAVYTFDASKLKHWEEAGGLSEHVLQNGAFGGADSAIVPVAFTR